MRTKTRKNKELRVLVVLICALIMLAGARAQAQETAPPLVRQLYNGNWPSQEEGQKLRDELFYQRAIHAYMTMLPATATFRLSLTPRIGMETLPVQASSTSGEIPRISFPTIRQGRSGHR